MFFPVHDVEWREESPSFISPVSSSVISDGGGAKKAGTNVRDRTGL
jgi:hypothetical protein